MSEDQTRTPTESGNPASGPQKSRGRGFLLAGVVALVIAGGAAYGILTFHQAGGFETATGPCAGTGVIVDRVKPKIGGEVAAMVPASGPLSLSQLQFQKADGSKTTLADWSGKTILLNLWATWCAPCRAEMPALDKLQAALGSKDFEVVTINVDSASAGDKPHKFLSEVGVKSLSFQSDPTLGVVKALQKVSRSRGLPTTMLIDGKGCEIGTMYGPAQWDSPDAQKLIAAAMGRA